MTKKKGLAKKITFGILGAIILFVLIVIINLVITVHNNSKVTTGQPIESYGENNSALLVIDIQEATTGSLSVYPYYQQNSDQLIKNINRITDSLNKRNIPVIYIRNEISDPLINLINNSFAKGSRGAQFDKRMNTASGLEVIKKEKDAFKNTSLDSILISNRTDELYVTGLDAAECVNATVEAAQNRKYKVYIIEEAILSKSTEMKESMITSFKDRGVEVINIDSFKLLN